ncbi:hypothetical protein NEOC65_000178 [Neochlamydia sp. AcF65]|nr:hypothetical protein [Neochlamydia sp. AcF65]
MKIIFNKQLIFQPKNILCLPRLFLKKTLLFPLRGSS